MVRWSPCSLVDSLFYLFLPPSLSLSSLSSLFPFLSSLLFLLFSSLSPPSSLLSRAITRHSSAPLPLFLSLPLVSFSPSVYLRVTHAPSLLTLEEGKKTRLNLAANGYLSVLIVADRFLHR